MKTKRYEVGVRRAYWHTCTVEVEASSRQEAEKYALERLNDEYLSVEEMLEGFDTVDYIKTLED